MQKRKTTPHRRRHQLDENLPPLQTLIPPRPRAGWVKEIRTALAMPAKHLARRVKVAPPTLTRLEQSEAKGTITLNTLERLADALECDLRYVLIPRRPMNDLLMERARRVLDREEQRLSRTMALEAQNRRRKRSALRNTIEEAWLVESRDKRLWEEEE